MKAVKVWLSDGRSETFGNPDGPYPAYVFKLGECFTSLSLRDIEEGRCLGAMKSKTTQGGHFFFFFFAKLTDYSLPKEIAVSSGFCLGIEGQ